VTLLLSTPTKVRVDFFCFFYNICSVSLFYMLHSVFNNKGVYMETTRKFSRTLDEAFPKSARYGCSVERHRRHEEPLAYLLAVAIAVVLAACLVMWWSA